MLWPRRYYIDADLLEAQAKGAAKHEEETAFVASRVSVAERRRWILKEEELIVLSAAQLAMIQHDVILLLVSLLLILLVQDGVAAFYLPPSSKLRPSFASCSTALLYQRDVYSMETWAIENGYQKLDGVELYNTNVETDDWSLMTYSDIPAGTTVLFIPANIVLSSDEVVKEYSGNFDLELTENALKQMEKDLAKRLPLFRLLVKVLAEYEKGTDSFYYPWLASLPSQYYN